VQTAGIGRGAPQQSTRRHRASASCSPSRTSYDASQSLATPRSDYLSNSAVTTAP